MAAVAFDYPTGADLYKIEQLTLPKLLADRASPFLDNFPDRPFEDTVIMWEQLDNFTGVMQVRGYGNKPGRVNDIGGQRFMTKPLVYGEYIPLQEEVLTRRRMMGQFSGRMAVDDQVAMKQNQLLNRRLNAKELILANFVLTGTYGLVDQTGVVQTGDTWTPPTFSPATYAWSDHVNSTPLQDLMTINLVPFGLSVKTGSTATFWINQLTFNNLVLNRNANDFSGLRSNFGATIPNSLSKINEMFLAYGLPQIGVYDGFYLADNGTRKGSPTRFIPTGTGVLFAKRDSGAKPGCFAMTWNDQAQAAQPYTKVLDKILEVPRVIEVHDGFNGAPIIEYPGTIVVATGL